jgi:hypothetical protein
MKETVKEQDEHGRYKNQGSPLRNLPITNVSLVDFTVIMEPQVLLSSNAGGDPRKDFNFEVNQDLSSKSSVLVYNVFMDENQPEPLVYKVNINSREQLSKNSPSSQWASA